MFENLNVPIEWKNSFTKYPHGLTIFEAICEWTKQVDLMIDHLNLTDIQIAKLFTDTLPENVENVLNDWYASGQLADLINIDLLAEKASEADMVEVKSQLAEKATKIEFKNTKDIVGNGFVKALGTRLSQGLQQSCISVIGDSTGNGNDEWVYKTMQWLADLYPDYTTKYILWNMTNDNYDPEIVYKQGAGIRTISGVKIQGKIGNYISTPHHVNQSITGDIDIKIKLSLDEVMKGQIFLSKFGNAGQRGYAVGILPNGVPYFWISSDGTENRTISASAPITYKPKEVFWIRYILDVDGGASNHAVTFYTSDNGVNWVQLGIQIVNEGVTSLFNSTASIEIFSRGGGLSDYTGGTFYEAEIRKGFDGQIVVNPKVNRNLSTFTDDYGNNFTINGGFSLIDLKTIYIQNSSSPGMNVDYSKSPERLAKQLEIEPQLVFISYSHNEGADINYTQRYEDFCKQIQTLYPNTGIVCVTQNPQQAPEVNIIPHAIRNTQIALVSAKNNYGLVDVNRAFNETGNAIDYNLDGAHPNTLGNQLWADEVIKFLKPMTK